MKIALIHDALCNVGGAEKVFQYICEEFNEADIFTTCYLKDETLEYFKTRNINCLLNSKIFNSPNKFRSSFFYSINIMKNLDLSDYDIVLSSSASVAKYVKAPNGKHFSYCYYPTRAIWETDKYFGKSVLRIAIKPFIPFMKKKELECVKSIDKFIAISKFTSESIKKYYNRSSDIIYCPIDTEKFYPSEKKSNHFLIVSRLEEWKRVDYAIRAFNKLGYKLKIIGTGNDFNKLKKISNPNIEFLGFVNEDELAYQYSIAKAVIFTPELEYGLIPLEAVASGTPVIAYGIGGINETMKNYNSDSFFSSVFYYEQNSQSLIDAVLKFEKINFNQNELINYAKEWNINSFKKKIRKYITS